MRNFITTTITVNQPPDRDRYAVAAVDDQQASAAANIHRPTTTGSGGGGNVKAGGRGWKRAYFLRGGQGRAVAGGSCVCRPT